MSFEDQEQHELNPHDESRDETPKRFRISYSRDLLLSLSDLDVCKKLPSGFDQSILSEFEDVLQDRFRVSGSLSSQSYRRNDYSSSPPTRGDGNNYPRGVHGRWDSRYRDSDSQSDLDSDSGKRGNQSRRSWQVPEHDGLLGSGSFPRPPGFVTGTSGPKSRTNDQYQLNRSNVPYHPPRPYKAVPHLRRDTHDSFNDETFGSSENTSEDRAEEERKRRASFELMRKEHHKAFQEKQKNPEKSKDNFDFSELLEDSKDNKRYLNRSNESDEPEIHPTSKNESDKPSFPSAATVSRPLVPPGFSNPIMEKNIGIKPPNHPQPSEMGNELDGSLFHAKGNILLSGNSNNLEEKQSVEEIDSIGQLLGGPSIPFSVNKRNEKIQNFPLAMDITKTAIDKDNQSVFEPLEATESSEIVEHNAKDVLGSRVVGESNATHSTSILDKLFESALTLNGVGPSSINETDVKADDAWTPHMVQSSKFAQWFHEEEKKPLDDLSYSRPSILVEDFSSDGPNKPVDEPSSERSNDLLSLIAGGERSGLSIFGGEKNGLLVDDTKKIGSQLFDVEVTENIPSSFPLQLTGIADGHLAPKSVLQTVETVDKIEAVPAVLTCEDLEQSMLSEIAEIAPVLPPVETEQKIVDIDNHASQHLLSLLQKGESSGDMGILFSTEKENLGTGFQDSSETGKPLTLETLFGTAFMKELKSAGAPSESMRVDVSESSFPMMENENLFGPTANIGFSTSDRRSQVTPETIGERILGFDIQRKVDSSELQTEFRSNLGGFDDNLVAANDPFHNFISGRNLAKGDSLLAPENAVINSVHQDERTMLNYDTRESDVQYHKNYGQSSSAQLHPSQLNHGGPRFHQLDSYPANINAQKKFMGLENFIHHDLPSHQFPANLVRPPFHHPSNGLTGLDSNPQNPMWQRMHMSGNFPPHLARGFPRGAPPMGPHPNNQVSGIMQEPNLIQGFPFGQKQPNYGGPGIPPQADVGSGGPHPEALQRLIEMELRSNAKQPQHQFPDNQGIYGHELDTGFRFR